MKNLRTIISLLVSVAVIVALANLAACKKSDPAPSNTSKLTANNWVMQSVTVDGVDKTSVYSGLTIKFTDTAYTTTHGGVVWPASGTWHWTNNEQTVFERNDGLPVTAEVTATTLKLSLVWATTTLGGRVQSVAGQHIFNFVKQ
jgi:hypothetical protein